MPQASRPFAMAPGVVPMALAWLIVLGLQVPTPPGPAFGTVEISFTTTSFGKEGINALLSKPVLTEADHRALGVTRQEQQATSCSSAANAYMFTQKLPSILF